MLRIHLEVISFINSVGATAIVAIIGGTDITRLGYWFVLMPVLFGSILLLITAIISAKIFKRKYPNRWW
jgi:CBS-domain-containing membrane protein